METCYVVILLIFVGWTIWLLWMELFLSVKLLKGYMNLKMSLSLNPQSIGEVSILGELSL